MRALSPTGTDRPTKEPTHAGEPHEAACCAASRSGERALGGVAEAVSLTTASAPTDGMILIPGGEVLMGNADEASSPAAGEGPVGMGGSTVAGKSRRR